MQSGANAQEKRKGICPNDRYLSPRLVYQNTVQSGATAELLYRRA